MNVDGQEFKAALRRCALELGCVAFGVAEAGPVADHARLRRWLERGWHGDMGYLPRDAALRADPRLLLPGARSVICVALPYGPPTVALPPTPSCLPEPTARVAALFVGDDYHRVLHRLLARLTEEGRRLGDGQGAWLAAVDTKPLLERSLAVTAGLGAVGRHTQLIVPGHGSLVCLGVLLTDVALPPDAPWDGDPCRDCDRCLRACPTGALHPEDGLEAPRCLSYLTTASHAAIPEALRSRLGDRVYGCDACQVACPWNGPEQLAPRSVLPALQGTAERPREVLEQWLDATGRGLRRALRGTALGWLPPAVLKRSLCVVLGNLGAPQSRPPLERAAHRPQDLTLREHAAWALKQL